MSFSPYEIVVIACLGEFRKEKLEFTGYELFEYIKKRNIPIAKGTLYNTILKKLEEEGLVENTGKTSKKHGIIYKVASRFDSHWKYIKAKELVGEYLPKISKETKIDMISKRLDEQKERISTLSINVKEILKYQRKAKDTLEINENFKDELHIPHNISFLKTDSINDFEKQLTAKLFSKKGARIVIIGENGIGKSHFLYELARDIKTKISKESLNFRLCTFRDFKYDPNMDVDEYIVIEPFDLNTVYNDKFRELRRGVFTCRPKEWLDLKSRMGEQIFDIRSGTIETQYPTINDIEMGEIMGHLQRQLGIKYDNPEIRKELLLKVGNNPLYVYTVFEYVSRTENKCFKSDEVKNLSGEVVIEMLRSIRRLLDSGAINLRSLLCISRLKSAKIYREHLLELQDSIIVPQGLGRQLRHLKSYWDYYPETMKRYIDDTKTDIEWIRFPCDLWYDFFQLKKLSIHINILKDKEINSNMIQDLIDYQGELLSAIDDLRGNNKNVEEIIDEKLEDSCRKAIERSKRHLTDPTIAEEVVEKILADYMSLLIEYFSEDWILEKDIKEYPIKNWWEVLLRNKAKIKSDKCLRKNYEDLLKGLELLVNRSKHIIKDDWFEEFKEVLFEFDHILYGSILSNLDMFDEAIARFDRLLSSDPNNAFVWCGKGLAFFDKWDKELAKCYEKSDEIRSSGVSAAFPIDNKREAIESYDRKLATDPNNVEILNLKIKALCDLKEYDQVLTNCKKLLKIDPKNAGGWFYKAIALKELKRYEEADKCIDIAIELEPNKFTGWSFKGRNLLYNLSKYEDALKCFDKVLELNPKADVYREKIDVFYHFIERDAIKCFEYAIKIEPKNAALWFLEGMVWHRLNYVVKAQKYLAKSIKLDSNNKDALYYYSELLIYSPTISGLPTDVQASIFPRGIVILDQEKEKQVRKSIKYLNKVLEIDPTDLNALTKKVEVLNSLKDYEDLIECCDKILKIDPNNRDIRLTKATAYADLEDYNGAIICFNEMMGLGLMEVPAWTEKYTCHLELGQYEKALECAEYAINLDPGDVDLWFLKALAHYKLKQYEDSLVCYDKAFEINPELHDVWKFKGYVYETMDNYQSALEMYEKYIKIYNQYWLAWYRVGKILYKLGREKESIRYFDKSISLGLTAINLTYEYSDVWIYKGKALERLGKTDEGQRCFIEAVEQIDKWLGIAPDIAELWYDKSSLLLRLSKPNKEVINCLKKSMELDVTYLEKAKEDSDFDSIRNQPKFVSLLESFSKTKQKG